MDDKYAERIARALEDIAKSLNKLADPDESEECEDFEINDLQNTYDLSSKSSVEICGMINKMIDEGSAENEKDSF